MIRGGDKVWVVPSQGKEAHPAIVIKVSADGRHALVLSGTGTAGYEIPHEFVDPARRANKALKLTKPTYFYQTALHTRRIEELEVRENPPLRCPLTLWEKLQTLAAAGAKERMSAKQFAEWWPEEGEAAPKQAAPNESQGAAGVSPDTARPASGSDLTKA